MNPKTIAIVGGGQAAAMAAAALRQQGFDGELHLFSDEQHLPYERPPLSKAMLLDDNPQLQPILPADWWREHNVQLHLGLLCRRSAAKPISWCWLMGRVIHGIGY